MSLRILQYLRHDTIELLERACVQKNDKSKRERAEKADNKKKRKL